jgi:hypothetical protein
MHVVVWDPLGEYWEGALVPEVEMARHLAKRGACLMPCVAAALRLAADAGFFKRAWGKGWALPTGGHQAVCPLSIYALHDMHYLHWAARLVPTADVPQALDGKLDPVRGMLRLVPDGTQRGGFQASLEGAERDRVDLEQLGQPDEWGGWTVAGSARIHQPIDAKASVSLHGAAMGARPQLRVVWAALTQTTNPE